MKISKQYKIFRQRERIVLLFIFLVAEDFLLCDISKLQHSSKCPNSTSEVAEDLGISFFVIY